MRHLLFILLLITTVAKSQDSTIIIRGRFTFASAAPIIIDTTSTVGNYTFTMPSTGQASGGVYRSSDSSLLRNFFSGKTIEAGQHTYNFDGNDNNGNPVMGNVYIQVITSQMAPVWQDVIGNTLTGTRGNFEFIKGMAFSAGKGYAALGYNEQQPLIVSFDTSAPQTHTNILGKGGTSYFVATDGTLVYWSMLDPNNNTKHFVYATLNSTNGANTFSAGTTTSIISSNSYNAIDLYNNSGAIVTGLAVQKTGNFLFVSHGSLNVLNVLNKTTGATVQSLTFTTPKSICVDGSDNLWMVTGTNTLAKYTVNGDGTLTATATSIAGLTEPVAVSVSPDGATVAVVDGGTSQQVKGFSNSTGASSWTLGTAGGYATSPIVANDKFYIKDTRIAYRTFIAYQPDGSFWVGDQGNSRAQHYNADRTYNNRIMYLPASYATGVDGNANTRVFSDYLEFAVTYPVNTWTLANNWGYNVTSAKDDQFVRLKGVSTLSNGKTYGFIGKGAGQQEIAELTTTGLRYTGVTFGLNSQLYPDGNIYTVYQATNGGFITWRRQLLTGFTSNNPTYATETTVQTSPVIAATDPAFRNNITTLTTGEITSNGSYVSFDGNTGGGTRYKIGTVKNNQWRFKGAEVTHVGYGGPFPNDGSYDVGNGVNDFSGSKALVKDSLILWGYHGEFWKNGQTNYTNILHQNGLFIKQFGTYGTGAIKPEMAGNAFAVSVTKSAGKLYYYHNDESYHGGVHRWQIDPATIQLLPVTYPTGNTADVTPGIDLMAGLPFNSVLVNNTASWTRSPATNNLTNRYSNYWYAATSAYTWDKTGGKDVYGIFRNTTGSATITRPLGTNTGLTGWQVNGTLNFSGNEGNNDENGGCFVDVLDNSGKVLGRIGLYSEFTGSPYFRLKFNGQTVLYGLKTATQATFYNPQLFSITKSGSNLVFEYGGYNATATIFDGTGAIGNPTTLRLYFYAGTQTYDRVLDVQELRFIDSVIN